MKSVKTCIACGGTGVVPGFENEPCGHCNGLGEYPTPEAYEEAKEIKIEQLFWRAEQYRSMAWKTSSKGAERDMLRNMNKTLQEAKSLGADISNWEMGWGVDPRLFHKTLLERAAELQTDLRLGLCLEEVERQYRAIYEEAVDRFGSGDERTQRVVNALYPVLMKVRNNKKQTAC